MLQLYILRHGKSSHDGTKDFNRDLNDRGVKDAENLGKFLKESNKQIDYWLSSSAKRALKTAKIVNKKGNFNTEIDAREELYLASAGEILEEIVKNNISAKSLIIIGHNPGLTTLANYFGVNLDDLPTCGLVCFEFDVDSFQFIDGDTAEFKFAHFPKKGLIVR